MPSETPPPADAEGSAAEGERLAALARENPNPVLECDAAGRAVYASPAAERLARGLGLEGVQGLLPPDHRRRVEECLERGEGHPPVETVVGDRVLSWTYRPHLPTRAVFLFAVDVTGQRLVEGRLRHDALHDALTGLPNRLLFMERLRHSIARAERHPAEQFAVLFLDLDRFKLVNDSLGHQVGDRLLQVVARRLHACLRTEDTVARLGGDEFAVLLEDVGGVNEARRVVERLQAEVVAPVTLDGFEVHTSASVGIALGGGGSDRPETLLRNADMAMYRAKAVGPARFAVFDLEMHARAVARLRLETDLRHAVGRGELRLHYQPIVALGTGEIHGLEALVRWSHPERGPVAPDEFVSVAEETGAIVPIGAWVLEEACRQLRAWRDRFPAAGSLTLAVNLSARQFSQPDLAGSVARTLAAHGLPGDALRLEITERAIVENADAASGLLARLRAHGVRISLDDFGTGYSSLGYLHRFPLDTLKVDQSFIGRTPDDPRSTRLVEAILTLARGLGIAAVAEGIETEAQLAALRALGCPYGQGYLFSRPLSPEAVADLLGAPSPRVEPDVEATSPPG